jgi:hypothetical protein
MKNMMSRFSFTRSIFRLAGHLLTGSLTLGVGLSGCQQTEPAGSQPTLPDSNTRKAMEGRGSTLAGTWRAAAAVLIEKDVQRDFYGRNPEGRLILDADGNYMLTVMRSDIQFTQGRGREQGTDEENRNIVHGSIANFGTYQDSSNILILHIHKATYPNWDGITQRRPYRIVGDTLFYEVPNASSGNATRAQFTWIRVKDSKNQGAE